MAFTLRRCSFYFILFSGLNFRSTLWATHQGANGINLPVGLRKRAVSGHFDVKNAGGMILGYNPN